MHFSVPDTQELKDEGGSAYTGYNIHINGVFHCTVRYRQLHNLHEQLKKEFGSDVLPFFPPKKLFPLSAIQLEERRILLEKYIQAVCQDSELLNSDLFNGFLLSAQQETSCEENEEVPFSVYLMNGTKISVHVLTTDKSDYVLEKVCRQIGLAKEHANYFSLYVVKREEDGDLTILRKLHEFESPYISQKIIKDGHRIVLRKSYWDPGYDLELMSDHITLNLLYIQTVADVERGWVLCSKETQQELASLQARGDKKEYIELARTLKYYGFLQFKPCFCDYPHPNSVVLVSVGNRELNVRVRFEENDELREGSFKVTRMRCWRITTLHSDGNINFSNKCPQLELSFEYLMSKNKLQWVTVASEQAILMSVCLQSMVDELLMKKTGMKKTQHTKGFMRTGSWSYMKRDGSSHMISFSQSLSSGAISSSHTAMNDVKTADKTDNISSMKKFSEKLSSVSLKSSASKHGMATHPLIENDAFEGIGDDDL